MNTRPRKHDPHSGILEGPRGLIQLKKAHWDTHPVMTLLQIAETVIAGNWKIPPHQRGDAWSPEQQRIWAWDYIVSTPVPQGEIALYFLTNDPDTLYINDGQQRCRALTTALELPQNLVPKLAQSRHTIEDVYANRRYSVSVTEYPDHLSAATDFQGLNQNSHLTLYEFCFGPAFRCSQWWNDGLGRELDMFHHGLESHFFTAAGRRRVNMQREHEHRRRRHNLMLIARALGYDGWFISPSSTMSLQRVKKFIKSDTRRSEIVEYYIAERIDSIGVPKFKETLASARTLIADIGAQIEDRLQRRGIKAIDQGLVRWLVEARLGEKSDDTSSVWPIDSWELFLDKILDATRPGYSLCLWPESGKDGPQAMRRLNLGDAVSEYDQIRTPHFADGYFAEAHSARSKRGYSPTPEGQDSSHVDPRGNDRIAEARGRNRARGRQVMDAEIVHVIKKRP